MKKITLLVLSLVMITAGFAQFTGPVPFPKTINVTGSAEMEIVPDEIYVQVELGEYEKKGSGKVSLESIKKKFFEATRSVGIPDSLINIASYQGNSNIWERKKKKNPDMLTSITYQVEFKNVKLMDALVDKMDDEATRNFYITRTSHSQLEQFRKALKMEAVKAAKEKAHYLAEAINEKVGVAVTINEPVEFSHQPVFKTMAMSNARFESADAGFAGEDIDFNKIKIKYDVNVVFQLL